MRFKNLEDKNLDDIINEIPELNWIITNAHTNAKKDGTGRKHGELTKKELLSYTKCLIRELDKMENEK